MSEFTTGNIEKELNGPPGFSGRLPEAELDGENTEKPAEAKDKQEQADTAPVRQETKYMPRLQRENDPYAMPLRNPYVPYRPSKKNLMQLRKSFYGNPFSVFSAEEQAELSKLEISEDDRMALPLAAFYADCDPDRMLWALNNINELNRAYFGKETGIKEAYNEIRADFIPLAQELPVDKDFKLEQKQGTAGELTDAVMSGFGRIGGSTLKLAKFAMESGGSPLLMMYDLLAPENAFRQWRKKTAAGTGIDNAIDVYDKYTQYERASAGIRENWFTDSESVGEWLCQALKGIAAEGPPMLIQFALMGINPAAGTAVIGISSASDKYYDLQSEEISPRVRMINAVSTGLINGGLERITAGIIHGKGTGDLFKKGIKAGMLKFLGYGAKNAGKEGLEEFLEQLAENAVDLLSGVGGADLKRMSLGEIAGYLGRGIGESFVIGGAYGTGFSIPGYISGRELNRLQMRAEGYIESRLKSLKEIANPTEEQVKAIQELEMLRDADSKQVLDYIATDILRVNRARGEKLDAEAEKTDEELSQEHQERYSLRHNELAHNPQDTADAAAEAIRAYNNINLQIDFGTEYFSEEAKRQAEQQKIDPDYIRGWYDSRTDTVHINANQVRPSEAGIVIAHEVVGHKGLQFVFGEHFDAMLDQIYEQHIDEFAELNNEYHFDLSTVDGQRGLAEEYLAERAEFSGKDWRKYYAENMAEIDAFMLDHDIRARKSGVLEFMRSNGDLETRPGKWKAFLQRVRMFLSKRKGFENYRFTDGEIETMIQRGINAMRKRARSSPSGVNEDSSDIRFAALRREGAPNTADQPGQLRDGNVPHKEGFLEENKLSGKGIYADYEFLRGKHPEYFKTSEEARAVTEFVLMAPESAAPIGKNLAFVRKDESTGKYYRIEIEEKSRGKYNHIRSAHELTEEQYKKAKSETMPGTTTVIDSTRQSRKPTSTVSDFLRYNTTDSGNVKDRQNLPDGKNTDIRFAALRREGAPNTADLPGQLRDGNVPHKEGFLEENGFDGKGIYADYEFLRGRHPEYFPDVEHVRAAVEFVLDSPEPGGRIQDNPVFVRKDWNTGKIYRLELKSKMVGKRHQVRSIHEITEQQYKKIRDRLTRSETASPDSVRHEQTLKAGEHPNMKDSGLSKESRSFSDFLRYNSTDAGNVKSGTAAGLSDGLDRLDGKIRFALFDNPGKRDSVLDALQKIADGSEEETIPNLRNDLEQYGGTNDITLPWGNLKKGIYHIAYRRGTETLLHVVDALADGKIERYATGNKTVHLVKDGYEAILSLDEHGKKKSWLLTGWEINKPDAFGKFSTKSEATQTAPTFSRRDLGAGLKQIRMIKSRSDSNISSSGEMSSGGDVKFSISPVYTGSAADYDAPSLQYIGTGEGAQVYGWGLYGSSSEKVARWYAETDAERKNRARILLDGKEPDPEWLDKADLSGEPTEFEIENSVLEDVRRRKGSISGTLEYYRIQMNKQTTRRENPEFYRNCREWLEKNKNRIQYIPENDDLTGRRNLYRQTFFSGKQENLLDWDKPVTEEQQKKIEKRLKEEGLCVEGDPDRASAEYRELKKRKNAGEEVPEAELDAAYKKAARLHIQRNVIGKTINGDSPSGSMIYENLEEILGDPKAVSEFLSRAGIDGVAYIGRSSGVRNYIAFSDQDIRVDEHIKFSLDQYYSPEDRADIIGFLKPFVGRAMERSDADYLNHLRKNGFDIRNEEDAHVFAAEAVAANGKDSERRWRAQREQWQQERYPLYGEIIQLTGDRSFKIKPSFRFKGEDFTGTFIADQWRGKKASGKEKTGLAAVEADYKNDIHRKKAKGYWSDELARMIADKRGGDANRIEQEIIDTFRDLTRPIMDNEYKKFRESALMWDRQLENDIRAEYEAREEAAIEDEASRILKDGTALTKDYISSNRKVFEKLYELVYGKKAPRKYSEVNLEAMNAAIETRRPELAILAEGYRQGRKKAFGDYRKKIAELKEEVMKRKADVVKLQREAMRFAAQNLPLEHRTEFVGRILSLMNYSALPSKKYPDGRRKVEFDRIFVDIVQRGKDVRKEKAVADIRKMLDSAKTKTNYRGIKVSILPEEQATVNRIREIINMDLPTISKLITYNSEFLLNHEQNPEKAAESEIEADRRREDNLLLAKYGNLSEQNVELVEEARKELEELIKGGRAKFRGMLEERKTDVGRKKEAVIREGSFGKNIIPEFKEMMKRWHHGLNSFDLAHKPIIDLLRISSGMKMDDFENSQAGAFAKELFYATHRQQSGLNRMQTALDDALKEHAGIDSLLKKGAFFQMIVREEKESGVYINKYSTQYKDSRGDPVVRVGQRPALRYAVSAEHCRALLEDINNGFHADSYIQIPYELYPALRENLKTAGIHADRFFDLFTGKNGKGENVIRIYSHEEDGTSGVKRFEIQADRLQIPVPAENFRKISKSAEAFLKEQLIDFDAGIKEVYNLFGNDEEDAMLNADIEANRTQKKITLFTDSPAMVVNREQAALSPAAALQILLTWEQDHYKPNMEWNGWTAESIEQLKVFLNRYPGVMELGYWMRDYIKRNKAELDKVVYERYGCHLPDNPMYFPATFAAATSERIKDAGLGRGDGTRNVSAGFLTERRFHLKPVDIQGNAFANFMGNQLEQNHFIAFSGVVRDLLSVYNDKGVQNVISDNFGHELLKNLHHRIGLIAADGERASKGAQFINSFYRYWVPAKIAFNGSSGLKQIVGVTAYMDKVPIPDFIKYMSSATFLNPDFREFVEWAKETEYFKNRMAGGMNQDFLYLLNYTRDSKDYNPMADAMLSAGTWLTKKTDAWSILHGGYAAYCYFQKQALKQGKSKAEAHEYAYRMWGESTDETQQSGYMKDLNAFQANQGAWRFATAFLSNPIRTMSLETTAMREFYYAKDKKMPAQKLLRIMIVNHLIVPTLMTSVSNLLSHGLEWDEWNWEHYFLGFIMGSYEGLFLVGKFLSEFGQVVYDTATKNKSFGDSVISAVPLFDDVARDAKVMGKIMQQDEMNGKDIMDSVKTLGDALMLSPGNTYSKVTGALLTAIGTQGKRIVKRIRKEEQ